MGKVGRSYPRFEQPSPPRGGLVEEAESALQARLGAIIGVLCALGLISWVMMR